MQFAKRKNPIQHIFTYSIFVVVFTFVELASSVFAAVVDDDDDDDDVVDAAAAAAAVVVDATSSDFVSFFAHLFTITTINFFSSKLYDAMVLSSANIKPKFDVKRKQGCQNNAKFEILFLSSLYIYSILYECILNSKCMQ